MACETMLLFTLSFPPLQPQPVSLMAPYFFPSQVFCFETVSTSLLPLDLSHHFLKEAFPDPLECQILLSHYLTAL